MFLPGESQGQGSLVGCCLWGHTESDTTEATQQQQQQQQQQVPYLPQLNQVTVPSEKQSEKKKVIENIRNEDK